MTDVVTEPRRREPLVVEGLDRPLVAALVGVPLVVGPAIAFALTLGFDPILYVVVTGLTAIATRPVIWHVRAFRLEDRRAAVYRARRDATANTSFIAALLICLAIYDILPLPGAPFWTTQQPRASFTLLSIIVYLVWTAQYARIPVEVRDGWKRLLGR